VTDEVIPPAEGDELIVDPTTDDTHVEVPAVVDGVSGKPQPSALDAINEAVELASKGRPAKIEPKGEQTPDEKAAELAAVKVEDAKEATAGRVRGADGKFRAMTDEEKTARDAAAKAADDAKKPDHVNDPIEKGLSERTTARMKALVETVKSQAGLMEQHTQLFDAVRATGANPNEFAAMLQYMTMVRQNDPAVMEKAYGILQGELRALSIKMGKPVAEVNLLTDPANKDLVDEIVAGKISNPRAHEIAVARARLKGDQTAAKTTNDAERQKADAVTAEKQGRADLDGLEGELRKRDGDGLYQAKYDVLVPMLDEHFTRLEPKFWKETFRSFYDKLKVQAPAVPVIPAKPQPLRPKQPAGSGNSPAAPKSALEAINAALEGY
jgi:hypothetical protein